MVSKDHVISLPVKHLAQAMETFQDQVPSEFLTQDTECGECLGCRRGHYGLEGLRTEKNYVAVSADLGQKEMEREGEGDMPHVINSSKWLGRALGTVLLP